MTNSDTNTFDAKSFIASLTQRPGVYQMLDQEQHILYVGKAKNLKNRVGSYFRASGLTSKTVALVNKIANINITVTHSETEALLLEQNLIKEHRPPYNILLRDDKSYPYIFISPHDDFPLMAFRRSTGKKHPKGSFYGPYPNSHVVKDSIQQLQKIFMIRSCEDTFFKNRSRPCLQYQIKRCTAPCVGNITAERYQESIKHAQLFLEGKSSSLIEDLKQKMEESSKEMAFEQAAIYRDQIHQLRQVQEQQYVITSSGTVDVFAVANQALTICVEVLFVREGKVLGSKTFFPSSKLETSEQEILEQFIPQFYLSSHQHPIPKQIITNIELIDGKSALEEVLSQASEKKVSITHNVRNERAKWLKLTQTNAEQQLVSFVANKQNILQRFKSLQESLDLPEMPERLECFDISHHSGEGTVASCVVFDTKGPLKSDYRRFNIEEIQDGDDYAAMEQAITRRYKRLKTGDGKFPDILLIDGGKGQLGIAEKILEDLQINDVLILGVAKGTTRKAGFETFFKDNGKTSFTMNSDSPALHLIQHIRDEAHRFAITANRQKVSKARQKSFLEGIQGVGPKRRREILKHFGGLQEIKRASAEEISKVPGISQDLANRIYGALHD